MQGRFQSNAVDCSPVHGAPNDAPVVMPKLGLERVAGWCFEHEAIKCSKFFSPMFGCIVGVMWTSNMELLVLFLMICLGLVWTSNGLGDLWVTTTVSMLW